MSKCLLSTHGDCLWISQIMSPVIWISVDWLPPQRFAGQCCSCHYDTEQMSKRGDLRSRKCLLKLWQAKTLFQIWYVQNVRMFVWIRGYRYGTMRSWDIHRIVSVRRQKVEVFFLWIVSVVRLLLLIAILFSNKKTYWGFRYITICLEEKNKKYIFLIC